MEFPAGTGCPAFAGHDNSVTGQRDGAQKFAASFGFEETPDQHAAIHAVIQDMVSPRPMDRLVCGDVGFGKTEVAVRAAFAVAVNGRQVLFLCPTTILAEQHWNTFRDRYRDFPVRVEMVSRFRSPKVVKQVLADFAEGKVEVLIGTHRVLSRDVIPKELGLVIVDEAHHAKAISYQTILEHLKAGQDDGPLLIGVTATPDRGDGKGLVETFDEIVFTYDMLWGIRAGYLSDLRGVRVHIDADFSKVKVSKGDYDVGQAGQMLHDANAPEQIVEAWTKYASDRKTIVFTPTVATAEEVMLEFIKVGVPVGMVSGAMPIDERRDVLARYASGDIQVIANCAVLTEGFDDPETSCIVIARPTKSRSLYTQMIGRGTRRHPHKQDCMVLDVVGASATHNLVTVPSLFGIEKEEDFEEAEKPVTVAVDEQVAEEVARGELKANEADLFRKVLESPIAWVDFNNALAQGCYMCSLGNREAGVVIIEPIPRDVAEDAGSERLYHSYTQWDNENVPSGLSALMLNTDGSAYRTLITGVNLEMAQGVAEDYVRKNGAAHLVDKDAPWRKKAPSPAQLEAARKWRMAVDPAWSCGELSDALSAHIAAKKARSKDKPKRVDNRGWSR